MNATPDPLAHVAELEARQDEALRQLVELDERIEAVLRGAMPSIVRLADEQPEAPAAPSGATTSAPPPSGNEAA